jgi:branched-subunit amino acid aminotransferase/4-amino-4-deoxychorismate lyase
MAPRRPRRRSPHPLPPPGARGCGGQCQGGLPLSQQRADAGRGRAKGYGNALVADALGNVAETATANIFMVRDGEVFTPIANGTFLAGITRARHISNLRADGHDVHETVLSFDDFRQADEVFMSGNMSKVTPVTAFDGTHYQVGDPGHLGLGAERSACARFALASLLGLGA